MLETNVIFPEPKPSATEILVADLAYGEVGIAADGSVWLRFDGGAVYRDVDGRTICYSVNNGRLRVFCRRLPGAVAKLTFDLSECDAAIVRKARETDAE